jgi:hypothetical protein
VQNFNDYRAEENEQNGRREGMRKYEKGRKEK